MGPLSLITGSGLIGKPKLNPPLQWLLCSSVSAHRPQLWCCCCWVQAGFGGLTPVHGRCYRDRNCSEALPEAQGQASPCVFLHKEIKFYKDDAEMSSVCLRVLGRGHGPIWMLLGLSYCIYLRLLRIPTLEGDIYPQAAGNVLKTQVSTQSTGASLGKCS